MSTTNLTHIIPLLLPSLTLVSWTFIMEVWMYATRLPAFSKVKNVNSNMTKEAMNSQIPANVRWKADNYNHLHEQPMIFYAVMGVLVAVELASGGVVKGGGLGATSFTVNTAWLYVGLRVVHSVVHAAANPIMIRFSLFAASSVVLAGLTAGAWRAVL
jgi:hypothetical protein